MNQHQLIALRKPCFEAEETAHWAFGWRAIDRWVTLRLTLNIGLE